MLKLNCNLMAEDNLLIWKFGQSPVESLQAISSPDPTGSGSLLLADHWCHFDHCEDNRLGHIHPETYQPYNMQDFETSHDLVEQELAQDHPYTTFCNDLMTFYGCH